MINVLRLSCLAWTCSHTLLNLKIEYILPGEWIFIKPGNWSVFTVQNMKSAAWPKFPTPTDTRLNACRLSPIHMPFISTDFANSSLPTNEGFAIIFTLLNTWIPINFGLVRDKTPILQYRLADGTLACDTWVGRGEEQDWDETIKSRTIFDGTTTV